MTKIKYFFLFISFFIGAFFVYYYVPYKPELLGYYDKIWAHRVNSLKKLDYALKFYDGVELDLVYNETENFLDVNHLPQKSIHLSFENYISHIYSLKEEPFLWLDIKNLKQDNSVKILKKILQTLKHNNYPINKVIVESKYYKSLPIFIKNGFKTSYYLPTDLNQMSFNERELVLNKIEKVLETIPESAISSGIKDYTILKNKFPERDKYFWSMGMVLYHNLFSTRQALKDPSVKIVLTSFRVFKGDR
ncbi:hypothetical protein [Aquimarina agarilytica]|uniref:hypothetical protein n=1 Tax=Aquimarina agarilytica TaxID=1087449 RepID=UPI000287D3B8|nr:hypothetical protein [Aquimarina agarilytica]